MKACKIQSLLKAQPNGVECSQRLVVAALMLDYFKFLQMGGID